MSINDGEQKLLKLGERIQAKRQKMGLTLKQLAEKAGYDERTIRNVIKGKHTRPQTLATICQVLDIEMNDEEEYVNVADKHGKYTLELFWDYEGCYLAYRRSFTFPNTLVRSAYEIKWDEKSECLTFTELQLHQAPNAKRVIDLKGEMFISNSIGLVHLLTKHEGALRLVTLTKLNENAMQGVVLTQAKHPVFYQPAVSPIFLQKLPSGSTMDEVAKQVDYVKLGAPDYEFAENMLREIETNVGIFALSSSQIQVQ